MALHIMFDYVAYAQNGEPLSSFDLAHIMVSGSEGSVSTTEHSPSEMLFLTIVELLNGVRLLLADTRHKQFVWDGVYGKFSVTFQKTGKGVVVSSRGQSITTLPQRELARDVFDSVSRTLAELDMEARLAPTEPIYGDLQSALNDYRQFLAQCS